MCFTALWELELPVVQWTAVITAALAGAGFDLFTRRVPNVLTGTVLVAGLAWSAWVAGLPGLADSVAACLLLLCPFLLLFLFGGGGAGDAKLMAALGAWLGIVNATVVLVCVAAAGVLMAVGFALAKKRLREVWSNIVGVLKLMLFHVGITRRLGNISVQVPRPHEMRKMQYSPAIFAGVCMAAIGVFAWRF